MATVDFEGKSFEIDEDGFLLDYNTYSEEWVEYVKGQEGIEEMNDEHWKLIKVLQDYYEKNGIAPMVRVLSKLTKFNLNIFMNSILQVLEKVHVKWLVFQNQLDVYSIKIKLNICI